MVKANDELNAYLALSQEHHDLRPVYSTDGDCLSYYESGRPCHAQRVNDLVTIYLDDEDESLVGCKIKDITRTLKSYGPFGVALFGREVMFGFLFTLAGVKPESVAGKRNVFREPIAQRPVRLPDENLVGCA